MTGLKDKPIDEIVFQFYGNLKRWPTEPDGINWTQAEIIAVAKHMSKTGDCLWHAQAVVKKWTVCHCAYCNGPFKERAA
jgi:hypothetical protein